MGGAVGQELNHERAKGRKHEKCGGMLCLFRGFAFSCFRVEKSWIEDTMAILTLGNVYRRGAIIPVVFVGCKGCGNLATCICALRKKHAPTCRFRRAAELSFELACDHGLQACPECDPCTCGAGESEGVR